jgi:hypothetical protein
MGPPEATTSKTLKQCRGAGARAARSRTFWPVELEPLYEVSAKAPALSSGSGQTKVVYLIMIHSE